MNKKTTHDLFLILVIFMLTLTMVTHQEMSERQIGWVQQDMI